MFDMPRPEAFAVLAPSGVYYGRLSLDPSLPDPTDHLVKHQLLPAAALQPPSPSSSVAGGGGGGEGERPLSMVGEAEVALPPPGDRPAGLVIWHGAQGRDRVAARGRLKWSNLTLSPCPLVQALTQYHLVLLYPSKLQYVNRTSKQVVQEVALSRFAAPLRGAATMPLGLCRDQLAGRIYVLAGARRLAGALQAGVESAAGWRAMWPARFPACTGCAKPLADCGLHHPRNRTTAFLAHTHMHTLPGDDALEVDATGEERDMWRAHLERGDYGAALLHCRT